MNYYFFEQALKESQKSLKTKDVPIGAVLVKNNKIISKSHNKREKNNKITSHAEINCILKANKKLKSYFLYDCDLYVTLKPCEMCKKIIDSSRIENVYYLLEKKNNKKEYNKTNYKLIDCIYTKKSAEYLRNFFDKLR